MREKSGCQLTTKDFAILEGMLDMLERQGLSDTGVARLLRMKLSSATVSFRDDIDPRAATVNSRIEFRVNDGSVQSRLLTHGGENAVPGATLPISTSRGLALLGLLEGDVIAIEASNGETETLRMERVIHQPEAARRIKADASATGSGPPLSAGILSIAKFRTHAGRRPQGSWLECKTDDDDPGDDPGPQAA